MNSTATRLPELNEPAGPGGPGVEDGVIEDAVIEEARRRARRRRRTFGTVVAVVAVACAVVFVSLDRTPPSQSSAPVGAVDEVVPLVAPGDVEPARAAWCVPDPADPENELIVGAGPPVKAFCSYTPMHDAPSYCPAPCPTRNPARANHLFQTAGSTILMSATEGLVRVANGRLTRLADAADSHGISRDGRYLATTSGQCGAVTLHVHEIATAREVATTSVPNRGHACASVAGLDYAGRVYVPVRVGDEEVFEVLMYDIRANRWAKVVDIPTVDGRLPTMTYMTATGFAVAREQTWSAAASIWVALASVEGVVDTAGRFTAQRQVPVGMGVWSPDRTYVAEGRLEGVVVRPAADLTEPVILDLSVDQSGLGAWGSNIHWESSTSVLVQGGLEQSERAYRCDVRSGACKLVDRTGSMALGENAAYGG